MNATHLKPDPPSCTIMKNQSIIRLLPAILAAMIPMAGRGSAELLALYRFEDASANLGSTIADSSVNGRNGSVANSAVEFVPGRSGFGNAARFTTANGFVTAALPVGGTVGDFAIAFWMKPESLSGSSAYVTARNGGGSQMAVIWEYLNDHVELFSTGGNPNLRPGSGIPFPDAEWRHIVYTRSGTEYARYVDGIKTVIGTLSGDFNGVAQNLLIGAAETSGAGRFAGLLDDVAWFSQGLDQSQVDAIRNGDFSAFIPDPALQVPKSIDLGTLLLSGAPFNLSIDFTNRGGTLPLDITGLSFTGPDASAFAAGTLPSGIVPNGGTGTVLFTFTPQMGTGPYSATAILQSNDPRGPVEIELSAWVEEGPELLTPFQVTLPRIRSNAPPSVRQFTVRNVAGAAVLEISGVAFEGPDAARFGSATFPPTLQPGQEGIITFAFDPQETAGTFRADCVITSNDILSPMMVGLEIESVEPPVGRNAYQRAVIASEPLLYWTFDEEESSEPAVDKMWGLATNELRPQGSAGRVASPIGLGNAADFNGVRGSRFIANTLQLGATSYSHYAIQLWVRLADPVSRAYLFECWSGSPAGTNSPAIIHGFNPNLEGFFGGGGRTGNSGPTTLTDMGWHHVVMEVNVPANTHSFYVDGVLAGTFPGSRPWLLPALAIGSPAVNTDEPMIGQIDELALYDLSGGMLGGLDLANHFLALDGDGDQPPPQPVVAGFDPATSELSLNLGTVPAGRMFHLRGSTDLEVFAPLSPPVNFDSTTPQPLIIQTGGEPRFFLRVFEGVSP
jgi:hypothetical protein